MIRNAIYGRVTGICDDNGTGDDRVIQVELTIDLNCQSIAILVYFNGQVAELFHDVVVKGDYLYVIGKMIYEVGSYGEKVNNIEFYADTFTKV